MQFLKSRFITYFQSDSIPFVISLVLFVFTILSLLYSIGCHPFSSHLLSHWTFEIFKIFFILSIISVLGIFATAIYQLIKISIKKEIINLGLFFISLLFAIFGLGIIFIVVFGAGDLCSNSPSNQASALEVSREWARLAPLPKSAKTIKTEITGSAFTREFIITFEAPKQDIETWLKMSPGTKNIVPIKEAGGILRYQIKPGGGAEFAEIIVSRERTKVRINTYWN